MSVLLSVHRGGSLSRLSRGGVSQLTEPGGQSARGVGQSAGGVSREGSVSQGGQLGVVSAGGGSAKIGQQNEYSLHGGW